MGEGCNPALRRRIAFCLRLAHAVATRRNVYNARAHPEMRCEKFREVERGRHTDRQRVAEFLVTALVNALHQRERVIHQHIHVPVFFDDELRKLFEDFLGEAPHKAVILANVDVGDLRPLFLEFTHDSCTNPVRPARHHDHFIFKRFHERKYTLKYSEARSTT